MTRKNFYDLTVIICCYNSESRIIDTLLALSKQHVSTNLSWSILLVNNASTDNTESAALNFWQSLRFDIPLEIIFEPKPGIGNARRTGILSSSSDYILFCDDDNHLSNNYIEDGFLCISSNPHIGILTAKSNPVFEGGFEPIWFNAYSSFYAIGSPAPSSSDITAFGHVWTAGAFLRSDILKSIYLSNVRHLLIGRKQGILLSGEDSELAQWFIYLGFHIYYLDNISFDHFIPLYRQNLSYARGLKAGIISASSTLRAYQLFNFQRQLSLSLDRPLWALKQIFRLPKLLYYQLFYFIPVFKNILILSRLRCK